MGKRLPSFNIPAIIALRDRLVNEVFIERYNETPDGVQLDWLVRDLASRLPKTIVRDAIFETARQLVGVELKPEICFNFSWYIAGNLPLLKSGRPVGPWRVQVADEWAPLQAVQATVERNRFGEIGTSVRFRVLAGTATSLIVTKFIGRRFGVALARRIGFSASYEKYPFSDAKQLIGLRFLGELSAAKSTLAEPRFEQIACPASMIDYNRGLLKLRLHHEPCPKGYIHPCHRCVVGYRDCPAGTHRMSYEKRFCEGCGTDAYFDPDSSSPLCVTCDERARLRTQKHD